MGKRGNGEGSITRRKDGLYMAPHYPDGHRSEKRKTLYGNRRGRRFGDPRLGQRSNLRGGLQMIYEGRGPPIRGGPSLLLPSKLPLYVDLLQ